MDLVAFHAGNAARQTVRENVLVDGTRRALRHARASAHDLGRLPESAARRRASPNGAQRGPRACAEGGKGRGPFVAVAATRTTTSHARVGRRFGIAALAARRAGA